MATIKDISKLAKVSATTVSRVLNQDEAIVVSRDVRNRICQIAYELNYVPPRMRHAQNQKQILIGVADWHIVRKDRPNIRLSSLNSIAKSMFSKADLSFVRMETEKLGQYDGIIAFGVFTKEEMENLRMQSASIVFINSDNKDYEYDCLVMDFKRGIWEMLDYLMGRKQYRSIGYIGGLYQDGQLRIGYSRLEGIKETFRQYGCYEEKRLFVGDLSRDGGYNMAKEAIASGNLPEALLLGSDEIAEGVLEAFQEEGLRVPKDVAVVIYRDIETLESKWSTYTKVCMFPDIVWQTAIKLLLEQIDGQRKDNMTIYLPTKFEIGDSA